MKKIESTIGKLMHLRRQVNDIDAEWAIYSPYIRED